MTALYNEIDPFAAEWLRHLIQQGIIAHGVVDERSIEDLEPEYVSTFTQVHFFAGIGVWSYALRNAGWNDETPVWTGSCPCQPFSTAGKGNGFADERHLWPAFHYLIEQCRPPVIFGEQVASKDGFDWLDLVSSDLEATRYAVGAASVTAAGVGAPHKRQRMYWVADSDCERLQGYVQPVNVDDSSRWKGQAGHSDKGALATSFWDGAEVKGADGNIRFVGPDTIALADGAPARVGQMRGYGNAIVAPLAQTFIESYMETS